jgi:hypothetical protein
LLGIYKDFLRKREYSLTFCESFDIDFYFTRNSTEAAMLKSSSASSSEMAFTIFRWELHSERTFSM